VNQGFAEYTKHLFGHLHYFVGTTQSRAHIITVINSDNLTETDFNLFAGPAL